MLIELVKSKQRLTKSLVKQMPRGYDVLCDPHIVLGHVVNILDEYRTAIFQVGSEYYTLPLDFIAFSGMTGCYRKSGKWSQEFRFSTLKVVAYQKIWWQEYERMREKAMAVHIYLC